MNKPIYFIYLHGFNSSPHSEKAVLLTERLNRLGHAVFAPFLPPVLEIINTKLYRHIEQHTSSEIMLVGSSLGGYYAMHLAERYGLRAVLVNPAITPWEGIERYLGPCFCAYNQTTYEITPEYGMLLKDLAVEKISNPENFLLLLQTGDELLDYRKAIKKFPDSYCHVEQGGSHRFENFERVIPYILKFAGFNPSLIPHPHPLPQGEREF